MSAPCIDISILPGKLKPSGVCVHCHHVRYLMPIVVILPTGTTRVDACFVCPVCDAGDRVDRERVIRKES